MTEKVSAANTVPLSEEEVAASSVTKAAGGEVFTMQPIIQNNDHA